MANDLDFLVYDLANDEWVPRSQAALGLDHGLLTGLGDDDHAQYHNDARGDARYALLAHKARHENGGADEVSVAGLSGELADDQPAKAHDLGGARHNADTLANLNNKVSDATLDDNGDPRDPNAHNTTHQNGGADEINVGGLSGELADNQPPKNHAANHTDGTDDIQDAGAAQKGLLTEAAQTIGGDKTFNGDILPVADVIFQTGGKSLDLATNGAYFKPRRVSQEGQPTPASGELLMWFKPTGNRLRIVYNDPVGGVKDVMLS
jgi:hypothetical protein